MIRAMFVGAVVFVIAGLSVAGARQAGGSAAAVVSGELRQWHKVTLTVNGPQASETDTSPNPFTDYRMTVVFTHESGAPRYEVPGYFAADGDAATTSASSGNKWRAHLAPDKVGRWNWRASFVAGPGVATTPTAGGKPVAPVDGATGSFDVAASNKTAPDFRAKGRLQYVGKHYLRFAGSGEYFLKAGPDSPETLLAYEEFDNTRTLKTALHAYAPHVQDWKTGDPTWGKGKGKALIGAVNYLSAKGMNAMSLMPYNAGGDGDSVWPFVARDSKTHYDCSKLDQWGIVFDHAKAKGLYLHFKMQETEIDDNRAGNEEGARSVPASLDAGKLGPERKLYCRELIARFGHELALNWNIGEENTQSTEEVQQMVQYIHDLDPYDHHIVIHTFPNQQEKVYRPLLGDASQLSGASLQNQWDVAHRQTLQWVDESRREGRPWVTLGAPGGRRIIGTVAQVVSNLVDHGMDVQAAISAPKIDCSEPATKVDARVPESVRADLEARGHTLAVTEGTPGASPSAVLIDDGAGDLRGGEDPFSEGVAAGYTLA